MLAIAFSNAKSEPFVQDDLEWTGFALTGWQWTARWRYLLRDRGKRDFRAARKHTPGALKMPEPIQFTDGAILMLRKVIETLDAGTGLYVSATDIVPAAELVEAECATVRDTGDRIELRATPAGVEYMKMIDALLAVSHESSMVDSEIPEQYRWDPSDESVSDERRGFGP